ncbi:hypothetical protein [Curtobacterium sp. MCBD17_040]|uniref:hypothetical protein n=1 Tax=Curtobacterium sp. MCBD17_040 TaxID=2175674 RepID=UPI000DA78D52|nr:hypothetical protein [Curtobacterium sp. MCBD17_040]WIB65339.1 hypothetical protein DEI94_18200 [Curtobacterium sp. MCBD17_040]
MSQHTTQVPRFNRVTVIGADTATASGVSYLEVEQDGAVYGIRPGAGGLEIRLLPTKRAASFALVPQDAASVVVETRWNTLYANARRLEGVNAGQPVCDCCGDTLDAEGHHASTTSSYSTYPHPHTATPANHTPPHIPEA